MYNDLIKRLQSDNDDSLKQEAIYHIQGLERGLDLDAKFISGLMQLLKEQGINPSSTEIWDAAKRFNDSARNHDISRLR